MVGCGGKRLGEESEKASWVGGHMSVRSRGKSQNPVEGVAQAQEGRGERAQNGQGRGPVCRVQGRGGGSQEPAAVSRS